MSPEPTSTKALSSKWIIFHFWVNYPFKSSSAQIFTHPGFFLDSSSLRHIFGSLVVSVESWCARPLNLAVVWNVFLFWFLQLKVLELYFAECRLAQTLFVYVAQLLFKGYICLWLFEIDLWDLHFGNYLMLSILQSQVSHVVASAHTLIYSGGVS